MATETKYGIVVESIPEDEPIILFRAQDRILPYLLSIYAFFCELIGCSNEHVHAIRDKAYQVQKWQNENKDKVKIPD